MRRRAAILFAAQALGILGCDPEQVSEIHYDPYVGEAYPDRRAPVVVPPGGMGIVTDSLSDTLSLLDLGTGARFGTVPVGRDPVGIDGPHHVAVDQAAGTAFVALSYPVLAASGPHASHGSSVQSGFAQKLALDDFRILGQVRVDENPGDIVLSEDGKRLVVSHFDLQRAIASQGDPEKARATLAVIDPETLALTGSPDPVRITTCTAPHGVALSRPDGARAYIACYGDDTLTVVDLVAGKVVDRVPVAPVPGLPGAPNYGPYSAVLSPDGSTVAIGNTVSKDVRFFDVASGTVDPARTVATLGAPYFPSWSPDGALLYIPLQAPDGVVVIDVANGNAEVARRDFASGECRSPHLAEIVGAEIWVVCEGDHKANGEVLRLDSTSLATMKTIEVGIYPDSLVRVGGTP
jgi:hypothetical protein